jgi:hypothetical protein
VDVKQAIAHVRRMPRFRYQGSPTKAPSGRHRIGQFIAQKKIPLATRRQVKAAVAINKPCKMLKKKILWVNLNKLRSDQMCLRFDKMLRHLRRYTELQRRRVRPGVIMIRGVPILWDGNHRVTAAILLGKRNIRCEVFT